jgi:cysteinyl-tRNA synthetase
MPLRLYNTLTRQTEPFVPQKAGETRMYVCGMTPYDYAHVGNARSAVTFDILFRHLEASGHRVTYVRNVTDVDDKIIDRAKENGEPPLALSARLTLAYQSDMRDLGCAEPTFEPRVSAYIPEIVELIEKLVARSHAYEVVVPDGAHDVYFAVRSFPSYGKLSRRNLAELEVGARIAPGESKRDPLDFALWKGCGPEAFGWPSPWGKGRPGWHIECSAMGLSLLGPCFDIHGGGMDLIFPHHENEIAQSEGALPDGTCFARFWLHNGFLNIDRNKMSKSLGNVVKPRDVYRSNDPEALRYAFLTAHYRGPLAFDVEPRAGGMLGFPGVDEAERRVDYLYSTLERLQPFDAPDPPEGSVRELSSYRAVIEGARAQVAAALDDDLNTPVAIAKLGDLAKTANDLCELLQKRKKDPTLCEEGAKLARHAKEALQSSADVLGLLRTPVSAYRERTRARRLGSRGIRAEFIESRIEARARARQDKDFARADAIRGELLALGIEIADSPDKTTWTVGV